MRDANHVLIELRVAKKNLSLAEEKVHRAGGWLKAPPQLASRVEQLRRQVLRLEAELRQTVWPPVAGDPDFIPGRRWAVLAGIDKYEDEENYLPLHTCSRDAGRIRQALIRGGFDLGHTRLLTDASKAAPTRANILAALKEAAQETHTNDLLLFYYSGHGDDVRGESYLVARDGRLPSLPETGLSLAQVKEALQTANARAKVIILDACHSGANFSSKGSKSHSHEFIHQVFEQASGLAVLASSGQEQVSFEWKDQGSSVFTYFLLQALSGKADFFGEGFVTVNNAFQYVAHEIRSWAARNYRDQTPTLSSEMVGDIILVYTGVRPAEAA